MANEERIAELIASLKADGIPIPPELVLSPAGKELRAQELRTDLADDGIFIEEPVVRTPIEQSQYRQDVNSLAQNPDVNPLGNQAIISDTANLKENATIVPEEGSIQKQTYVDVLKDLKRIDKIAERLPFVGSIYKTERMVQLMDMVKIINSPIGTQIPNKAVGQTTIFTSSPVTQKRKNDALKFVEQWVTDLDASRNRTTGAKFTNALLEMPAFIVEFMLTGPLFSKGSATAKTAAKKILGEYAENATGRLAVRAAGAGFGSLARTAVNVPKVMAGAAERLTEGIEITDDGNAVWADGERNPWTALSQSFLDLYIENLSEIAGGAIGEGVGKVFKLGGKLAKKFPFIDKATNELAEAWIKNAPQGVTRTLDQFLTKATTKVGFNGILGEFSEERLGDIMRAATGLQEWEDVLVSKEEALIEAGIFAIFGGVNLASEKISRGHQKITEPFRSKDTGLTKQREQEIKEGKGEPPTEIEQRAFINLGAGEAEVSLFDSAKNKALADKQNKEALEFIESRIGQVGPDGKPLILPGDDDDVPDFESDLAKDIEALKVVNAATKSKAIQANAMTAKVAEVAKDTKLAVVRNIARAEDAVGTWGKTGKKVQKDLREISFRTAVNVGNTTQNIKPWVKGLSKAEKTTVAQLIDGAIPREGQPNRLLQRADAIRKELDVIQKEALDIGLRQTGLSGKAFPQVLNKEGQALMEEAERDGPKSAQVFAWAQNQVKDGKFETVEDAIIGLQQYREGLISGKTGYIEGSRTLEIGNEFRDWNLDQILSNTIESSWEKIEAARQWGVLKDVKTDAGQVLLPFKDIQIDMAKIRSDVGNNEANALNEYLKAQYGLSGADTALVKVARAARTAQFVGKLAFSPLTISRNILDRYAKGLSHGTLLTNARAGIKYPPFLNHWMESARNIEEQMIRNGAVLGHGHLSEGFSGTEGALSLIAKPFASSEKGNQTYIALVKKMQLEADVKRLMELDGREGPTSKVFDRMATIVGQSQKQTRNRALTSLTNEQLADAMAEGKIDDGVMAEVLHRTTTDSAFPLTLASKRLWWNRSPVMQAATQFKVWSADQTRFIYKDVLRYGIQTGDYSRLGRFILGTWLMGEIYNISRDFLLNEDESVLSKAKGGTRGEIMMAVAKDLVDGGIVGMLADFTYGIGDWAAGPTVNSMSGIATAIDQSRGTASLPEALGQFALQDAPALKQAQGVIDSLDSIFDKNNLTEDYSRWQNRSFDFRRKQGESAADIVGGGVMRSLRGVPRKRVTERSLSLNMVARQVLVGDYDDATKHIERVIEQTEVQDLKSTIQSFKQSMLNNSPLGNIAKKELPLFLGQFSAEEVAKGLSLQKQWLDGYNIALTNAVESLKKRDLEAEAKAYADEIKPEIEKGLAVIKEALEIMK
jgi:hypothetical protein